MGDEANTQRSDRLTVRGRDIDSGGWCSLFVTREADSSWTVTGPVPLVGVRVAEADIVALAEAILERSR